MKGISPSQAIPPGRLKAFLPAGPSLGLEGPTSRAGALFQVSHRKRRRRERKGGREKERGRRGSWHEGGGGRSLSLHIYIRCYVCTALRTPMGGERSL